MEQERYNSLGASFKKLRENKGLSQESLAKTAGIGRSTLVHLEGGADVRLSRIAAVAKALGADVEAVAEPREFAERKFARLQQLLRMQSLQKTHLRIAVRLVLDEPAAIQALDEARKMVDLWEREKVCSAFYIDAWRKLLMGSPREAGAALSRIDEKWEAALLQNSPFAALIRQPS